MNSQQCKIKFVKKIQNKTREMKEKKKKKEYIIYRFCRTIFLDLSAELSANSA
jgi:coenzyme F420-reducing hydrogenase beta subunit